MTMNRILKLPWQYLDPTVIRAASLAVAKSLPGVTAEVELFSPTSIRCYFVVSREIARAWEGPEFDRWYAPGQPPVADPLHVEIGFTHLEADSHLSTDLFLMSADMGHSSNGIT